MGLFHIHDWVKDGKPTFTPPIKRAVKGTASREKDGKPTFTPPIKRAFNDFWEQLAFGFTTQVWRCTKCDKSKLEKYTGDQRELL